MGKAHYNKLFLYIFIHINEKSLDVGCCNMINLIPEYCIYNDYIIFIFKFHYNKLFMSIYININEKSLNAGCCNMVRQYIWYSNTKISSVWTNPNMSINSWLYFEIISYEQKHAILWHESHFVRHFETDKNFETGMVYKPSPVLNTSMYQVSWPSVQRCPSLSVPSIYIYIYQHPLLYL